MFDRFTDNAKKAMGLALQEAQRFNHDYIGTEHILLGLIDEWSGVAADVLKNLDVDPQQIRQEVERLLSDGTTMVTVAQLPFTPASKKVLELKRAVGSGTVSGMSGIETRPVVLKVANRSRSVNTWLETLLDRRSASEL